MTTDLTCHMRSIGHLWEPHEPLNPPKVHFGVPVSHICVVCGTTKYEVISSVDGRRLSHPVYRHSPTYARGADVPSPDELRKEYLGVYKKAAKHKSHKSPSG